MFEAKTIRFFFLCFNASVDFIDIAEPFCITLICKCGIL